MPELKLVWQDGGHTPKRTPDLPKGINLEQVNLYIGTKGKIITRNYGSEYKVILDDYKTPPKTIDRIAESALGGGLHEMDWVRACKENANSRKEAASNFDFAGPLTEMVLMGTLALRLQGLERELEWDGERMEFNNIGATESLKLIESHVYKKENMQPSFNTKRRDVNALEFASELIKHNYRKGWSW
jgi:hypothetical protein